MFKETEKGKTHSMQDGYPEHNHYCHCGKLLKPAYDKIAKKITGYLFQCPDHPEFYLSVG